MSAGRGLEGTCWLAAAILAVALVLGSRGAGASAEAIQAATSPTPQRSVYEQRCIERILARAADKTEEEVAARIKADCFASRRDTPSWAGLGPVSCGRAFTVQVTPAARRVAGCLGG